MDQVRIGVVGLGNMGSFHVSAIPSIHGAKLTALCDADAARVDKLAAAQPPETGRFTDYNAMLASGLIDAVLIATPHFQHCEIVRAALSHNIHVLCEKPVAVTVGDARRTNEAAAKSPHLKFALVYQMRTVPLYQKMRELIQDGELGEITRFTWIVTDWFRPNAYYASSSWRATWSGEGGGVLINQCPHNLDLVSWITGMMPNRVTAVAFVGKTHPIETEDEVSAILEFPNGASGHFITTTGEAPGTNRLEIAGDRGKLVAEHGKLTFTRNRKSAREVSENDPAPFATIESWEIDIPYKTSKPEGHGVIVQNFINAILKNEPLIAPGTEGIKGLELGNAMLMSGLKRTPVTLPLDAGEFDQFLKDLDHQYGGQKKLETRTAVADVATSFHK